MGIDGLEGAARSVLMVKPRDGFLGREPAGAGNWNDFISSLAASIDWTGSDGFEGGRGGESTLLYVDANDSSAGSLDAVSSAVLAGRSPEMTTSSAASSSSLLCPSASFLPLIISLSPDAIPPDGEMARSSSRPAVSGKSLLVGEGGVEGDVGLVSPKMEAPTSVAGLSGREWIGVGGEIGIETDERRGSLAVGVGGDWRTEFGRRGLRLGRGGEVGIDAIGAGGRGSCVVGANEGGSLLILLDNLFPFLPESDPDSNVNAGSYMDALA